MILVDSRRLTGPNLQTRRPAAIVEVTFEQGPAGPEDPEGAIAAWRAEVRRFHPEAPITVRRFSGGAALCVEVPLDELLATTEINEWALERATAIGAGLAPGPVEPRRTELAALLQAGRNPALMALEAEARHRGVPLLWDDSEVTLGMGARSRTFALGALPAPSDEAAIPWAAIGRVPVALITGTNGKTTTTRLLGRIAERAGRAVACASTVGITVGEGQIEDGDWTGPAAARRVLRLPEVELALLETARGGILRRGLGVDTCDAAVITNVSADHLGSYGIDDVSTMAEVKAVVARAVMPGGRLVLCADDPHLVALAGTFAAEVVYFSLDAGSPVVAAHRARGGEAWFVTGGQDAAAGDRLITCARGPAERTLVRVGEVPIAFDGAAPYNVANALAAAALAAALGIDDAAIVAGLRDFHPTPADNPGRGNLVDAGRGVRLLLDYGHNPEAIRAVLALASTLRGAGRLLVVLGQPGDRSDEAMGAAAARVAAARPEAVVLHDMPAHLRGRQPHEVPSVLGRALNALGQPPASVQTAADEAGALEVALRVARSGDLVVILPHTDDDEVSRVLADRAAATAHMG